MFARQLAGQQGAQVAPAIQAVGEDGRHVGLRVDGQAIIDAPVQVDGQVGHYCNGALEVDQAAVQRAVNVAESDATGQRQVAVKPGREQGAAVDLDAQLPEPLLVLLWLRLHTQAGAVGMGANQTQTSFAQRTFGAQLKGDQRGVVAGHQITPAGLQLPVTTLIQRRKAGRQQARAQGGGGVKGGGGGSNEIGQILKRWVLHVTLLQRGDGHLLRTGRGSQMPCARPFPGG